MMSAREPYSQEAREFYRAWAERRARHRPAECHYAENCWVTEGQPAAHRGGRCKGCGGYPVPAP